MNPLDYIKKDTYKLYINGEKVIPEVKEKFKTYNPVNNELIAEVYKAGEKEINMAISAARDAFDTGPWGKMSNKERSDILYKASILLEARLEEFAIVETLECGKLFGSAY